MFGWGASETMDGYYAYIIGADGHVARVFEKVKPEGHAAEVAAAVQALR